MGGGSYDRDVYAESSSSSWGSSYDSSHFGTSKESEREMGQNKEMDSNLSPIGKIIVSHAKTPIVVVLDVTGSNIDFAKVVYDKMPMFYGQIERKGYLEDFDICFCAVGDTSSDKYPIQITDFAKGITIDDWLKKVVLEGNGGVFGEESYEAMAYYLLNNFEFEEDATPIVFFIGDERCYSTLTYSDQKFLGVSEQKSTDRIFQELRHKLHDNIFMLLNKACGREWLYGIYENWKEYLPTQHTIKIEEEKSIVDLMLGIIALCSKTRTLDGYIEDMREREQTETRRKNVKTSLDDLSKELLPAIVIGNIPKSKEKPTNSGKRL